MEGALVWEKMEERTVDSGELGRRDLGKLLFSPIAGPQRVSLHETEAYQQPPISGFLSQGSLAALTDPKISVASTQDKFISYLWLSLMQGDASAPNGHSGCQWPSFMGPLSSGCSEPSPAAEGCGMRGEAAQGTCVRAGLGSAHHSHPRSICQTQSPGHTLLQGGGERSSSCLPGGGGKHSSLCPQKPPSF